MDGLGNAVELLVGWKPRDAAILCFRPDSFSRVSASISPAGKFIFEDVNGHKFQWLGDVKNRRIQRNASELASHIHTPGTDDFEWLREASKDDGIDFDAKPAPQPADSGNGGSDGTETPGQLTGDS